MMFEFDSISFVNDEKNIIYENDKLIQHRFMISCATFSGAHFFSQSFDSINEAKEEFSDYIDVVNYFGGGICDIYEYSFDCDTELIHRVVIH